MPHGGDVDQFIRHRSKVMTYLRSLMQSPDDAADLFQDLFLAVLVRGGAATDPARFLRWCRAAARNLALHHWRAARRRREIFSALPASEARAAVIAESASTERAQADRDCIRKSLEGLDARSRRLLLLRYVAGETSEEIAHRLRQTPAAVRMRLMRALDQLRGQLLGSTWHDGPGVRG